MAQLRAVAPDVVAIDTDEAIVARNDGVWPDMARKNEVLIPAVLDDAERLDEVIVLNSFSLAEWTARLRASFTIVLLDLPADEQARRDEQRFAEEGWTNREWFDWHRQEVAAQRDAGLFDHVVDAARPVEDVAADLLRLLGR